MNEDNKRKINRSKIKTIKYIEDAIDKIEELKENYIAREEEFDINQKMNEVNKNINLDEKGLKEWKDRSVKHLREQKRDIKAIYTLEKKSQRKLNALLRPKKLLEKKVQKISNDISKTQSKQEQIIKDIEELEAKIDRAKSLEEKDELTEQLLLKQGSLIKIENKLVKLWDQLAETKVKLNEEIKKLKEIMSTSRYSLSNDDIEVSPDGIIPPSASAPSPAVSSKTEKEPDGMSEKDKEEIRQIVEGPLKDSKSDKSKNEKAKPAKGEEKDKKPEEKGQKSAKSEEKDKKPEEKSQKPAKGEEKDKKPEEKGQKSAKGEEKNKKQKKEPEGMSEKDKKEIKQIVEGPSGGYSPNIQYDNSGNTKLDYIERSIDRDEDEEFAREQKMVANRARMIRLKSIGRNVTKPFKFLGTKIKQLWSRMKLGTNTLLSSANHGVITAASAIAEKGQKAETTFQEKREKFIKQYESTLTEEQQLKAREESKQIAQQKFEEENELDDSGQVM